MKYTNKTLFLLLTLLFSCNAKDSIKSTKSNYQPVELHEKIVGKKRISIVSDSSPFKAKVLVYGYDKNPESIEIPIANRETFVVKGVDILFDPKKGEHIYVNVSFKNKDRGESENEFIYLFNPSENLKIECNVQLYLRYSDGITGNISTFRRTNPLTRTLEIGPSISFPIEFQTNTQGMSLISYYFDGKKYVEKRKQ